MVDAIPLASSRQEHPGAAGGGVFPSSCTCTLGSLDSRALCWGPGTGAAPGHPPAGRVAEEEEKEEEEEDVDRDPHVVHNVWLRCCHFFLRGRREPESAMGGCEVREFLVQFGLFLPLLTAWPSDCSHVSNNQGKARDTGGGGVKGSELCGLVASCGQLSA